MAEFHYCFREDRLILRGDFTLQVIQNLLNTQETPWLVGPQERAEAQLHSIHKWIGVVMGAITPLKLPSKEVNPSFFLDAQELTSTDTVGWVALNHLLSFLKVKLQPRPVKLLPLPPQIQAWAELYGSLAELPTSLVPDEAADFCSEVQDFGFFNETA